MSALARALMVLTGRCLGEERRAWALAMEAEFDAAEEDGRSLAFAVGCLSVAWREMPRLAVGRLVLANHALALGLLIPVAFFQFAYAIGLCTGPGGPYGLVAAAAGSQDDLLVQPQLSAIPALLMLWVILGIGHLRLAWVLLDCDWGRVVKTLALIGSATLTLLVVMKLLSLDATSLLPQAAALAVELAFILAGARWHARLFPDATPEAYS